MGITLVVIIILAIAFAGAGGFLLYSLVLKKMTKASDGPKTTRFLDLPASSTLSPLSPKTWLDFYVKGQEKGFSLGELRLLLKLVRTLGIHPPSSVLASSRVLNEALGRMMSPQWRRIIQDHEELQDLVYKLLVFRMNLEKQRPKNQKGLDSTRNLPDNQVIKLLLPEKVLLMGRLTDSGRSFMKIQITQGKIPLSYSFKGKLLELWFWRSDDAMYQCASEVIQEPEKTAFMPMLTLRHSDNLVRKQKRSSLRARVLRDGEILPLMGLEEANESYQARQGYQCRILDVSETGFAVIIRGKVNTGIMVKIQLEVDEGALVMCGEVKSVDIKQNYGVSVLHVEAFPLSRWMRTLVMSYVLGFLSHGTDPLPKAMEYGQEAPQMTREELADSQDALKLDISSPFQEAGGSQSEPSLPKEET